MIDRSAIRERLRRLLAMTTANGASEAEAMVAADKAARLMAENNMSYRSVDEIEAEGYANDVRPWFTGMKGRKRAGPLPPVHRCLPQICTLCGVEHLFSRWTGELTLFGPPHATEAAHYLVVIISRAMDRAWEEFCQQYRFLDANHKRSKRGPFYRGIGIRIAARLTEMLTEHAKAAHGTGNSLVAVKNALVKQRFGEVNGKVDEHSPGTRKLKDYHALLAGWEAGANVALSKGVNEASGAKLLTKAGAA